MQHAPQPTTSTSPVSTRRLCRRRRRPCRVEELRQREPDRKPKTGSSPPGTVDERVDPLRRQHRLARVDRERGCQRDAKLPRSCLRLRPGSTRRQRRSFAPAAPRRHPQPRADGIPAGDARAGGTRHIDEGELVVQTVTHLRLTAYGLRPEPSPGPLPAPSINAATPSIPASLPSSAATMSTDPQGVQAWRSTCARTGARIASAARITPPPRMTRSRS